VEADVLTPTREQYQEAFEREAAQSYPMVDYFEFRMGYLLSQKRYLEAARVLACPIKAHAPNWQHGRVLYALAREHFSRSRDRWQSAVRVLDVGTAKGFSALCLQWALNDVGICETVYSVDVIDPTTRVLRNTVAEIDGLKTLAEILAPWPESARIRFECCTGVDWLQRHPERLHFAYVDGKHTGAVVSREAHLIRERQQPGDVAIFDDVQIPAVGAVVADLKGYDVEYLRVLPHRAYAIASRV
jgi:predicted O-methyltransferase YrrM